MEIKGWIVCAVHEIRKVDWFLVVSCRTACCLIAGEIQFEWLGGFEGREGLRGKYGRRGVQIQLPPLCVSVGTVDFLFGKEK